MTTAMAQIERGLNRIYGIRRDRPAPRKYGRAAVLTLLLALPVGLGFLLLVAGGAFADAMVTTTAGRGRPPTRGTSPAGPWASRSWSSRSRWCSTTRPAAANRACPGWRPGPRSRCCSTSPAPGCSRSTCRRAGPSATCTVPLAGIMALLIWALLSSIALFYGAALCAQLEACRAGRPGAGVRRSRPTGRRHRLVGVVRGLPGRARVEAWTTPISAAPACPSAASASAR